MKKFCIICEKKQGFFSLNYKLRDGVICDDCVEPFGLCSTELDMLESATAVGALKVRTSEEIKAAVKGENRIFEAIRDEMFPSVPKGVLLKFDGGLGEHSQACFIYEDRILVRDKGFAGTKLGQQELIVPFAEIASVALKEPLLGYKDDHILFTLKDGSEVYAAYGYTKYAQAEKVKSFIESRMVAAT